MQTCQLWNKETVKLLQAQSDKTIMQAVKTTSHMIKENLDTLVPSATKLLNLGTQEKVCSSTL
jgi:hypothetical protein